MHKAVLLVLDKAVGLILVSAFVLWIVALIPVAIEGVRHPRDPVTWLLLACLIGFRVLFGYLADNDLILAPKRATSREGCNGHLTSF